MSVERERTIQGDTFSRPFKKSSYNSTLSSLNEWRDNFFYILYLWFVAMSGEKVWVSGFGCGSNIV